MTNQQWLALDLPDKLTWLRSMLQAHEEELPGLVRLIDFEVWKALNGEESRGHRNHRGKKKARRDGGLSSLTSEDRRRVRRKTGGTPTESQSPSALPSGPRSVEPDLERNP